MHVQLLQFWFEDSSRSCGWKMDLYCHICYWIVWWIWWVSWIWLKIYMDLYCRICYWIVWWIWWVCWIWLKIYKASKVYKIYKLHFPPPNLIYWLVLKSWQVEKQWKEVCFICYKIWVFKSSMLDGTNLTMLINVSVSNIARSCWLSGR